jgi:hypothetical protein
MSFVWIPTSGLFPPSSSNWRFKVMNSYIFLMPELDRELLFPYSRKAIHESVNGVSSTCKSILTPAGFCLAPQPRCDLRNILN